MPAGRKYWRYKMIGGTQELHNYITKSDGISRKGLNITCFVGVLIPLVLPHAFDRLGKSGLGFLYLLAAVFCAVTVVLLPVAYVILIIGWIHANRILTRYESLAQSRLAQIDAGPPESITIDTLVEKGLLQYKVLGRKDRALDTLARVLAFTNGGDPDLLNRAGVVFSRENKFTEARQLFVRALRAATEEKLQKQIQQNISAMDKAIGEANKPLEATPQPREPDGISRCDASTQDVPVRQKKWSVWAKILLASAIIATGTTAIALLLAQWVERSRPVRPRIVGNEVWFLPDSPPKWFDPVMAFLGVLILIEWLCTLVSGLVVIIRLCKRRNAAVGSEVQVTCLESAPIETDAPGAVSAPPSAAEQATRAPSPSPPVPLPARVHSQEQPQPTPRKSRCLSYGFVLFVITATVAIGLVFLWVAHRHGEATVSEDQHATGALNVEQEQETANTAKQDSTKPTSSTETTEVYTVKPGDTLFSVARKVYGDASKWKVIYGANPELGTPLDLRVGMDLRIPTGGLPRLVEIDARDSVPCKMMQTVLEQLQQRCKERLNVVLLDVEKDAALTEHYRVKLVPTQLFIDPLGREVYRHEGFISYEEIMAKWKELGLDLSTK